MKKDWLRTSLIAGIAFVSFLLVIRWNETKQDYVAQESQTNEYSQNSQVNDGNNDAVKNATVSDVPAITNNTNYSDTPSLEPVADTVDNPIVSTEYIHVKTDVLDILIDPNGGDIVKVALPTFYEKIDTPDRPFILLDNTNGHTYISKSGLIGPNGTDNNTKRPLFRSEQKNYELQSNDEALIVDLHFNQDSNTSITKRFIFKPSDHLIEIKYIVNNKTDSAWQAAMYGQIQHDSFNPVPSAGLGMQPFFGASTTTDETNYDKMTFDDIEDEKFEHQKVGGWVSMVQHYFFSAWIPAAEDKNKYSLYKSRNGNYVLQFTGQVFNIPAHSVGEKSAYFYAGPKDIKRLEKISPHLELTVDYSFLWWIAKPLFYVLDTIHGYVGNWGVAIILLTLCIKILFFYPSATSFRSMAKMRKLQPKMKELKERHGDDRQKFSAETMKLYKQEKVNPLSGCMPIVIQMPVFLALYWVLMESVELRHAPFMLWITDLSVKDPFYVLPLIYGASMWIQQKLNPTPPDPMQAKVMQMMPIFFTFLFLFFPAGLVLYWVINNTLSITQQYVITKRIDNQD